jgi:competence protein ComEC
LCLCCLFFWQKEKANQIEKLSISWLSIGQGNATVIAGETGFAMVDLGPKANQFQLISALKLNGIQKLDWILISHLHPDHYGGLWGLLDENIEIGEIQYHGHMLGGGEWGALVDRMKTKGIPLKMIQKGRFQWDGLIFEDLWDLSTLGFDLDLALENDLSIARMLILEGKGTILLSGDLEEQGEARLIVALLDFEKRYPHLPILAFQVNHHGSRTSSHPMLIALFEKHQAKAVISLGLNHKFGFPHPQTVYRLRALSSFRTDLGRIDFRFSTLKSP